MKKKLLFIITQFYKGGAETSLLNLFRELNSQQYEVDFIILNQVKYQDVTSLVEQIPEWIRLIDVIEQTGNRNILEKVVGKIYRRLFHIETYNKLATKIVKDKEYDVAFSFGEWLSPFFLAQKVRANRKYVWIHIDIDKADFVNKNELIKYDTQIDGYLFASERSMNGALRCCPQMRNKSYVVHNFLNKKEICQKAHMKLPKEYQQYKPFIVSVGNLRPEKNYPRQVEVMNILKERGVSIRWLCVGSTVNQAVYEEVTHLIDKYQLREEFILCGVDDNPYKYMNNAEAVMVLSDHESWSLVITEAKLLGIPVIATNTSGAQEQIVSHQTGIITGFQPEEIADAIEKFLADKKQQDLIKKNLTAYKASEQGLYEFEQLLKG